MPLETGTSRKVIGHNIAVEIRAGRKPAQAESIAYHESGESHDDLPGENPPSQTRRFYAPVKIGEKMSMTQEGFLIMHDVQIARTGVMLYKDGEIEGVQGGRDGLIRIHRNPDVVFHPDAIASFEGKPFTNDHPVDDVTPENWRELAQGHLQNVHRGEGDLSEFLIGDLLAMDKDTIDDIRSGKREVSLGYDADYEQIEPGIGRQTKIVGNHIALVDRGRCGPSCSIRDGSSKMKISLKDAIARAFKAKTLDEAMKVADEMEEGAGEGLQVHVHNYGAGGEAENPKTVDEKLAEAEKWINDRKAADKARDEAEAKKKEEEEQAAKDAAAKDGEGEELVEEEKADTKKEGERKTSDADSVIADFAARAELIAPGVKMPRLTKDAMADAKKTADGICICKRRALDAGLKIEASKVHIAKFLNTRDGATVDKLSCDRVDAVFTGVSEMIKTENNVRLKAGGSAGTRDAAIDPMARGGLNKIHKAFWEKQAAK